MKGSSMRLLLFCAASLALLAPVAAHADTTLTFTYQGSDYAFDLPATPSYVNQTSSPSSLYDYAAYYVTLPNSDSGEFIFYGADEDAYYGGTFDLEFFDFSQSPTVDILLDGDTLYSGSTTSPVFTPGPYTLTEDGTDTTIGLVIGGATPEPSSLVLLGTGVLTALAARRKLGKA